MKSGRLSCACALAAFTLLPGTAGAAPLDPGPHFGERKLVRKEASQRGDDARWSTSESFRWPVTARSITTHWDAGHAGIDIDGLSGDAIVAARSGTVTFAGDDGDGYGLKVIIRHGGGLETLYSHLASIAVGPGPIESGAYLGPMGCTGSCTGDHLHFEIRKNGVATNPLDHLP